MNAVSTLCAKKMVSTTKKETVEKHTEKNSTIENQAKIIDTMSNDCKILKNRAIPAISFNYNLIYMLIVMIYLLMTYD